MSDRAVTFANMFNFRDLGGLIGESGRPVRRGRLFRSDILSHMDDTDLKRFQELGIRTVVDLRRPDELTADGRIPEFDGYAYHHVHLFHRPWPTDGRRGTPERVEYLAERYLDLTLEAADGFATALRLIADPRRAPLVFHCLAGKDRTGVLAALTLNLLGVSDADIADDFALSEAAGEPSWQRQFRDDPVLLAQRPPGPVTPRETMLEFLAGVRERHGSVAGYVASIGICPAEVDALRAHLLATTAAHTGTAHTTAARTGTAHTATVVRAPDGSSRSGPRQHPAECPQETDAESR